jgi:cobalamin biosynthesis protein CobT
MMIYRKKTIVDKVSQLTSTEHNEIFKILEKNGVPHSRNKNGCFFDLRTVDEKVLGDIEQFVSYCIDNKASLEEYNKQLSECKLRGTMSKPEPVIETSKPEEDEDDEDEDDDEDDDSLLEEEEEEEEEDDEEEDEVEDEVEEDAKPATDDLAARKKSTSMFVNAKKRFSKRTVVDVRVDYDVSELVE